MQQLMRYDEKKNINDTVNQKNKIEKKSYFNDLVGLQSCCNN